MTDIEQVFGNPAMSAMFSCAVCREPYNVTDRPPMNLPCGHSLCNGCLPGLIGDFLPQSVMCPVCRKRHIASGIDKRLNLPKNWQMLEIIEKAIEVKIKLNEAAETFTLNKCVTCEKHVPEYQLTTCKCIQAPGCSDLDFMDRPKNTLICLDCITAHKDHDHKPIDAVKTVWDCQRALKDLKKVAATIHSKSESCDVALDNAKKDLAFFNAKLDKTVNRLDGRPRCAALLSLATNLTTKLEKMSKNVELIRGNMHDMASNLGSYRSMVSDYGAAKSTDVVARVRRFAPDEDAHFMVDVPEIPVRDDGVLRVGNDGNFQVQFRVALNEGAADGFHGEADRIIDQVVQRRLLELMPMIRGLAADNDLGGDAVARLDIELRPVHRRANVGRVNDGDEGIVVEMAVNELPLRMQQDADGNNQVVAGDNINEVARNIANVQRRVQRAYELLFVDGEQPQVHVFAADGQGDNAQGQDVPGNADDDMHEVVRGQTPPAEIVAAQQEQLDEAMDGAEQPAVTPREARSAARERRNAPYLLRSSTTAIGGSGRRRVVRGRRH